MTAETELHGLNVLVTRPQKRAHRLCTMIERAGGHPRHFAAMEIAPPSSDDSRAYARDHLDEFDLAVFISPTAVEMTLQYIPELPDSIALACIGSQTARAMQAAGLQPDIIPDGHDSESLLAHRAMQSGSVQNSRIVIFRGEKGRDQLADTLRQRGAVVHQADMYRRRRPAAANELDAMIDRTDVVCVSSTEGLVNLVSLAGTPDLYRKALVVPGERAAVQARKAGFTRIITAASATDMDCLDALQYIARSSNRGKLK